MFGWVLAERDFGFSMLSVLAGLLVRSNAIGWSDAR